jgi:hypothetical protein
MLELAAIEAIGKGIVWLKNLSDEEVRSVKDQTRELLHDLSRGLMILYDVTSTVSGLNDDQFNKGEFSLVFNNFKKIYYDNEYYANANTRCSDLERDVESISLRISLFLKKATWKMEGCP